MFCCVRICKFANLISPRVHSSIQFTINFTCNLNRIRDTRTGKKEDLLSEYQIFFLISQFVGFYQSLSVPFDENVIFSRKIYAEKS